MRDESEMLSLIIETARSDDRIRAVYMNGSRVNENAPKDIFQDYDIVYVVGETKSFREDKAWIDRFGERLYMQYPDDNIWYTPQVEQCYGWLIQLADGNRLDLHVQTVEFSKEDILKDKLCRILLDKDNCLPPIPEATDIDYWVKKPSEMSFLCVANEFWWCLNNVQKGLWRNEVLYVQDMLNSVVRPQLITMLSWKVGIKTDFSCSVGKSAKYIYKWLEKGEYEELLSTYAGGDVNEIWDAVFSMCALFDNTANEVASALGFSYNKDEADACFKLLRHVRTLPNNQDLML